MNLPQTEIRKNKLQAINKRNKACKIVVPQLTQFFKKYEGQDIYKVDLTIKKKYKEELDKIMEPIKYSKDNKTIRAYLSLSYSRVTLQADITHIVSNHPGGGHTVAYNKVSYHLCDYDKNGVVSVIEEIKIDTYTLKQYETATKRIREKNDKIEILKDEIRNIKMKYSDLMYS